MVFIIVAQLVMKMRKPSWRALGSIPDTIFAPIFTIFGSRRVAATAMLCGGDDDDWDDGSLGRKTEDGDSWEGKSGRSEESSSSINWAYIFCLVLNKKVYWNCLFCVPLINPFSRWKNDDVLTNESVRENHFSFTLKMARMRCFWQSLYFEEYITYYYGELIEKLVEKFLKAILWLTLLWIYSSNSATELNRLAFTGTLKAFG